MPAVAALELSDAGILARGPSGSPPGDQYPSPGFAVLDGGTLVIGKEARDRARLTPLLTHTRFWDQLGTDALPRPFPTDLTAADLVHAHLDRLWGGLLKAGHDELLLAVPGSQTPVQLGMILGIARSSGIPVVGMVDAAVAAASAGHPGRHLLHVDVHLHRSVVTEILQGDEVVRRRLETSDRIGLDSLHELWVDAIARTFVTETRFDPLHHAETEQVLFGRLPALLERLCEQDEVALEIDSAGKTHQVVVRRDRLVAAVDAAYATIAQLASLLTRAGRDSTILLSRRAADLPGLRERLAQVGGAEVVVLKEGAAAEGALLHADVIRSSEDALPFVTRLPVHGEIARALPPADAPSVRSVRRGAPPTHVLHGDRAYPITEQPFVLGIAIPRGSRGIDLEGRTAGISRKHCSIYRAAGRTVVEDHSTHGSFLNGQRIEGKADLVTGDRLRLGSPGIEVVLLRVEGDGSPTG
jgi:hypothetical protein